MRNEPSSASATTVGMAIEVVPSVLDLGDALSLDRGSR